MQARKKMTREEMTFEIIRLLGQLKPAQADDFAAAAKALQTGNVDSAPESFKAFLKQRESNTTAKQSLTDAR